MTFKAYLKKEFIESIRTHKLIILFMGFVFFAVSSAPLLKLTPKLLESQYGSEMANAFSVTEIDAITSYISSNLPQICILILCLTIGGILSNEVSSSSITLPITKGANKTKIVLAKFCLYAVLVLIISVISITSNIYYSFIVFNEEFISFQNVLMANINVYLYLLFIISIVFLFSSMFNKGIVVGFFAMGINLVFVFIDTFGYKFNPFNLIKDAGVLSDKISNEAMIFTVLGIIICLMLSVFIFSKKELDA